MRKIALSLFVIAASGAYVWHVRAGGDNPLNLGLPAQADDTGDAAAPSVRTRLAVSVQPLPARVPLPKAAAPLPAADPLPAPDQTASLAPADPATPPDPPAAPEQTASLASADPASVPIPVPAPKPPAPKAPAPAPTLQVKVDPPPLPKGQYRDGTYPGPTVDAYYGRVQVEAVVQGGKLVSVDVLQYPADRRTSRAINRQALPMLEEEVLSAQSAHVDIISGATLTSAAYRRSLSRALASATT